MDFTLFTANFSRFQPVMGVPVRSSNGHPRYALKYPLTHKAPGTFPPRTIMQLPRLAFRQQYREHLDKQGVDRLSRVFEGIAREEDEQRLVLLCFEDLANPEKWCHRTLFAEWWEDQTGQKVREMGPAPKPFEQGGLF